MSSPSVGVDRVRDAIKRAMSFHEDAPYRSYIYPVIGNMYVRVDFIRSELYTGEHSDLRFEYIRNMVTRLAMVDGVDPDTLDMVQIRDFVTPDGHLIGIGQLTQEMGVGVYTRGVMSNIARPLLDGVL